MICLDMTERSLSMEKENVLKCLPIDRATNELQSCKQIFCSCGPVKVVVKAYDGGTIDVAHHVDCE